MRIKVIVTESFGVTRGIQVLLFFYLDGFIEKGVKDEKFADHFSFSYLFSDYFCPR
ncbi:MAG: hypothetical protein N2Z23_04805 [Pyrinomonadaceae bacterium]|nr:hypothetical protein [Pyrinomonadaceae bacterium]MCX7639743.1 hypothetical protein [Pyrinomonadaceae bacterium]MDW8304326.1 hypothetical protein [Acidobacteriota bacterium]